MWQITAKAISLLKETSINKPLNGVNGSIIDIEHENESVIHMY